MRRADRLHKKAIAIYVDERIRSDETLQNRFEKASDDSNLFIFNKKRELCAWLDLLLLFLPKTS